MVRRLLSGLILVAMACHLEDLSFVVLGIFVTIYSVTTNVLGGAKKQTAMSGVYFYKTW